MSVHDLTYQWDCVSCGRLTWFEQPPCPDGHGSECDEWACVECGAAVLAGSYPAVQQADRTPEVTVHRAA